MQTTVRAAKKRRWSTWEAVYSSKSIVTGPVYTSPQTPKKKSKFITSFKPPYFRSSLRNCRRTFVSNKVPLAASFRRDDAVRHCRIRGFFFPPRAAFDIYTWELSQSASWFSISISSTRGESLALRVVCLWARRAQRKHRDNNERHKAWWNTRNSKQRTSRQICYFRNISNSETLRCSKLYNVQTSEFVRKHKMHD